MQFTVTNKGPTFAQLARDTAKDLTAANRKAGRAASTAGLAAMRKGAPRMWGRKLAVESDVTAESFGWSVEFHPAPHNAGGWAIQESGRRGGYTVRPRRSRGGRQTDPSNKAAAVLRFNGDVYRGVVHIRGSWGGANAWTKAGERLATALDRTIADVYDDALGV